MVATHVPPCCLSAEHERRQERQATRRDVAAVVLAYTDEIQGNGNHGQCHGGTWGVKDTCIQSQIDRLVHHSVIIELNVSNYRVETAKSNKTKTPT